jgi:hypothetical protein
MKNLPAIAYIYTKCELNILKIFMSLLFRDILTSKVFLVIPQKVSFFDKFIFTYKSQFCTLRPTVEYAEPPGGKPDKKFSRILSCTVYSFIGRPEKSFLLWAWRNKM